MTTIEYLLNKFPVSFQKKYKEKCPCGHGTVCYTYNYKLTIDVTGGTNVKGKWITRYRMYFTGKECSCKASHKHIGPVGGIGFLTQKEALKELLKYKEDIRGKQMTVKSYRGKQ